MQLNQFLSVWFPKNGLTKTTLHVPYDTNQYLNISVEISNVKLFIQYFDKYKLLLKVISRQTYKLQRLIIHTLYILEPKKHNLLILVQTSCVCTLACFGGYMKKFVKKYHEN